MPTLFDLHGIDLSNDAPPPPEKSGFARRALGDTGVSLLKGAIGVPEALVGLADIPTGGYAGKAAESLGFRPKEAKAALDELYSPEQQAANREVQQAQGFVNTAVAAVRNPSTILQSAVESAPSLLPAGVVARGALAVAPRMGGALAAGIGEGAVSAGQTAEQVRQETADGLLTAQQSAISAASGGLTGAIGAVAGKIANRLGIGDIDQLVAGVQQAGPKAQKSFARALLEGFATEGVLQELPQSAQEQIAQNVALGKPWDEGVGNAAAMGALAGGVMGAGAAPFGHSRAPVAPTADESMRKLATADNVGDMISAAQELTNAPMDMPTVAPAGLNPDQEDRALTAMERQMQADQQGIRFGGPREAGPAQPVPVQPTAAAAPTAQASAEFIDTPPLLDRLQTLNEQLRTPEVRETVRARLGDEALNNVLYYVQQANRPDGDSGIPAATRERIVSLAETILGRALLQPTAGPAQAPGIAPQPFGQEALTGQAAPAVPQLEADTRRTGTMRVDRAGVVAPETQLDAINTRQAVQQDQQARAAAAAEASTIEPQGRRASAVYGEGRPKRPAPPVQMPERRRTDGVELAPVPVETTDPVLDYVERMRQVATPQARAFVQDFNAGRITRRDVIRVMQSQGQDPLSPDQRLADAAAQAPAPAAGGLAVPQVYRSRTKATVEARKVGGEVIPVEGGFTVKEVDGGERDAAGPGGRGAADVGASRGAGGVVQVSDVRPTAPAPAPGDVERVASGNDGSGVDGALSSAFAAVVDLNVERAGRKAVQQEIASQLAEVETMRAQGRLSAADEENLLRIARTAKTGWDASRGLHQFIKAKRMPADAAPLTRVDEAANEAATSPANDLPEPTQAQKDAGNYKVGRIRVAGLDISVENPQGSTRSGVDRDGKAWENTLQHHYGYIRGTVGADKDHVDAFVKPGTPEDFSGQVFVVDQVDPNTGKFDEHKVLIGFDSEQEARDAYQANYAKGWKGLKSITAMPVDEFNAWVKDSQNTRKPLAPADDRSKDQSGPSMPSVPDIPRDAAYNAHLGTSHVPDQRAVQEQDGFKKTLRSVWDRAIQQAGNDQAAIDRVTEVFKDVAEGYRSRYLTALGARSRVMSSMIAGPARFPVERNRKRMETERKRSEEARQYLDRGIKRLERAARGPIDNSPEAELESLRQRLTEREELQDKMKAANAAIRKGDDAALEDLGFSAAEIADLKKGDYAGRKGFADYQLTNNNAEIRRLRERLADAERRVEAAAAGPVESERPGVRIVEDAQDDRLRLFFDDKPADDVREALKSAAFKWAPSVGAWQRQLTDNARRAAADVLDKFFPAVDTAKASRRADPERSALRWTHTDRNAAGPEFYGRNVDLIALREFDVNDEFSDDALPLGHAVNVREGNTAHQFMIVDHNGTLLGMASLEVNPDGKIDAIHDIEITDKRAGVGREVVSSILANADGPVRIIDILDQADAFWQKMGAGYKDTYGNATADWASYRAQGQDARAGEGRGPRAGQGLEAGRTAEGQPGSRQEGEVGPKANRLVELLRGSSGKGLPIRLAELYARQYETAGLHRVNVARSIDDLPAQLRAKLSGYGDDVRGAYFPSTDQIYVFTDNIASPDELHFVVMHEAFHRGLGAMFGDQGRQLIRQMYAMNQRLRERADLVAGELKISRDEAIEEALADMAGEGKAQGLRGWKRLAGMIRNWLRSLTQRLGLSMAFTDAQIETFVAGVSRAGINRDPAAQGISDGFDAPRVTTGADLAAASREAAVRQTDTAAFRRWFGDSKVVDAEGKPLVVYHGTGSDFSVFQNAVERGGDPDFAQAGLYFAENAALADTYGDRDGGSVMPVYLNIRNPLDLTNTSVIEGWKGAIAKAIAPRMAAKIQREQVLRDGLVQSLITQSERDRLIAAGYDGMKGQGGVWIAFRPEQIKSAIGNRGTFDPANPDVRASRGASMMAGINQQAIRDAMADRLKSSGEQVNWWQRTLGTQYDKAKAHPEYGRVFKHVQQYIEDTSALANEAADQAPDILPKLESVRDVFAAAKRGLSAPDQKAVAAPIFEGTLEWSRRGGKLVRFDDLQAQAEQMSTEDKARELLRDGKVTEAELKRWQATPLDIYNGAVRNRYAQTYLQPGVVFTRAELQQLYKLNDAQIQQYEQFRAAVGESLDQVAAADALRLLGEVTPEIRAAAMGNKAGFRAAVEAHVKDRIKQETDSEKRDALQNTLADILEKFDRVDDLKSRGYAPLMRFGRYFVSVKGQDGQQDFFGLYETRAEANRMARELNGDDEFAGRVEQGTMSQEAYKLFSGIPVESLEMFADAIGAEQSQVFQEWLRLTKNNRSALKRLIKRKGTEGFSSEVTRVLASFVTSNARMAAGAMNMPQAKEAAESIRAGDIKDEGVRLIEAVQNPTDTAGVIRGLMFAHFIGGSVASALVNVTQPVMMTLPWLSQWGGPVKAAARLMASARQAAGGKIADTETAEALKRAEKDGIVSPQEIHHLTAEAMGSWGKNPVLKRAAFLWGAPFSVAEQFNRRVTFLAAYATAKAEGIADPFAFAHEAVVETQGLYNKGNAPNWARNPIGATALTFKQYSIHYLEWIKRMWNAGEPGSRERTEGRKAVLFAMALLFMAGGSEGLPFAEDVNDLADTVMQALGFDTSAKGWKREFLARTLGMGDTGADVVMRGMSALPGIPLDVSMRMGMGNLLPGTGMLMRSNTDLSKDVLELAGPVGGLVGQYKDAGRKLIDGKFDDAALGMLPAALQNVGKGASMWVNGEARDSKGRRVMATDELDAVMKLIGFQPAELARENAKISEQDKRIKLARVVESSIADQWAQGLRERDVDMVNEARQQLADWNATNPESRIAINSSQIKRRLKEMQSDKADRFARTAPKEMRGSVAEALR